MYPSIPLGVPLMDADHATLEAMLARAASTADADLPALFATIEAEVIAHFGREEVLMRENAVPILHCHETQHRLLLAEIAAVRPDSAAPDLVALRRTFSVLAELVEGHVASVDRVTSQFLGGSCSGEDVFAPRLPEAVG